MIISAVAVINIKDIAVIIFTINAITHNIKLKRHDSKGGNRTGHAKLGRVTQRLLQISSVTAISNVFFFKTITIIRLTAAILVMAMMAMTVIVPIKMVVQTHEDDDDGGAVFRRETFQWSVVAVLRFRGICDGTDANEDEHDYNGRGSQPPIQRERMQKNLSAGDIPLCRSGNVLPHDMGVSENRGP